MFLILRRHCGFGNALIQLSALQSTGVLSRTILIGYEDIISSGYLETPFIPLASLKYDSLYTRMIYFAFRHLFPKTSSPLISAIPKLLVDFFGQDTSSYDLAPLSKLAISKPYASKLLSYLRRSGFDLSETLVIHARGGDYRTWPSPLVPALLPSSYYNKARKLFPTINNVLVLTNMLALLSLTLSIRFTLFAMINPFVY